MLAIFVIFTWISVAKSLSALNLERKLIFKFNISWVCWSRRLFAEISGSVGLEACINHCFQNWNYCRSDYPDYTENKNISHHNEERETFHSINQK